MTDVITKRICEVIKYGHAKTPFPNEFNPKTDKTPKIKKREAYKAYMSELILERAKFGGTFAEIAKDLKCSKCTVQRIIKKSSLYNFWKEQKYRNKIEKLVAQGFTKTQIVKKLKVPYSTLDRFYGARWK